MTDEDLFIIKYYNGLLSLEKDIQGAPEEERLLKVRDFKKKWINETINDLNGNSKN